MKNLSVVIAIVLALAFAPMAFGRAPQSEKALTITQLAGKIADYEKKDIQLTGVILGACGSGCKMWVGNKDYKDGDPVALVWAKDSAFKFKTDAVGQKVLLKGYAVAKYVNLCPTEKKAQDTKTAEQAGKGKKDCDPLKLTPAQTKQEEAGQLQSITFFATSVEYLK